MIPVADELCIEKYICPKCGEEQYLVHSRITPRTYSKEQVIVDEENKTVRLKTD
jgi:anaerobic ribonucleoside-triphosphate reductase